MRLGAWQPVVVKEWLGIVSNVFKKALICTASNRVGRAWPWCWVVWDGCLNAPTLAGCVIFIVRDVHIVFRLHLWLLFMWLHDRGTLNKHVCSLALGAHRKQFRVAPLAVSVRSCLWLMWSAESVFPIGSNKGKIQCNLFSFYFSRTATIFCTAVCPIAMHWSCCVLVCLLSLSRPKRES